MEKTTAGIGNGCMQAQGHKLWAHMLTIKLIDSSKLTCKKKNLTMKIPLPISEWLWVSPGPWAGSSHAYTQDHWYLRVQLKKKINMENTTVGTDSGCEQA